MTRPGAVTGELVAFTVALERHVWHVAEHLCEPYIKSLHRLFYLRWQYRQGKIGEWQPPILPVVHLPPYRSFH
jgi:hypothetical protein